MSNITQDSAAENGQMIDKETGEAGTQISNPAWETFSDSLRKHPRSIDFIALEDVAHDLIKFLEIDQLWPDVMVEHPDGLTLHHREIRQELIEFFKSDAVRTLNMFFQHAEMLREELLGLARMHCTSEKNHKGRTGPTQKCLVIQVLKNVDQLRNKEIKAKVEEHGRGHGGVHQALYWLRCEGSVAKVDGKWSMTEAGRQKYGKATA
jgi:hypothetical protein